jgi:hypothetical protein
VATAVSIRLNDLDRVPAVAAATVYVSRDLDILSAKPVVAGIRKYEFAFFSVNMFSVLHRLWFTFSALL